MAQTNPFRGIALLFRSLSGAFNEELDDEEGYDKKELAKLEEMSRKNISDIEESHGKQTMVVDDDKEGKDRLGIKKPSKTEMDKKQPAKTIKRTEAQQENDGRE